MSEQYINFTYRSPHIDFTSSIGYNSDGTVNIGYTLQAMRNLLQRNVELLDKLISDRYEITQIDCVAPFSIAIGGLDSFVEKKWLDSNMVRKPEGSEPNSDAESDYAFSDEEETNHQRLSMVNHLANQVESFDDEENSASSQGSNTDAWDDEKNTQSILAKYNTLVEENDPDSEANDSIHTDTDYNTDSD